MYCFCNNKNVGLGTIVFLITFGLKIHWNFDYHGTFVFTDMNMKSTFTSFVYPLFLLLHNDQLHNMWKQRKFAEWSPLSTSISLPEYRRPRVHERSKLCSKRLTFDYCWLFLPITNVIFDYKRQQLVKNRQREQLPCKPNQLNFFLKPKSFFPVRLARVAWSITSFIK